MAAKKSRLASRNDHKLVNRSTKNGLDTLLKAFFNDESQQEYVFPTSLSSDERAYIHTSAHALGLISRSHGKGDYRQLKLQKTELSKKIKSPPTKLTILPQTLSAITSLLESSPLTADELKDVNPLEIEDKDSAGCCRSQSDCIRTHVPIIPGPTKSSAYVEDRKKLPTWSHKDKILDMIANHQIVMISGDTGSGKTTQIPQYILDLASENKEPVRIVCTQPRRIAAISVAERVATERGENTGSTVGYQIRLESRMSSKTALVFCTTGILLRTLMYEENSLQQVTHLLIDEVHERDRFVDFLLGVLRSRLPRFPHLRLVIMSAALDTNIFSSYFSYCPVLQIEGKCFPITEYFLEDILDVTDHLNHTSGMEIGVWEEVEDKKPRNAKSFLRSKPGKDIQSKSAKLFEELDPGEKLKYDKLIRQVFVEDSSDAAKKLSDAITSYHMPVNYKHTQTQMTPLMAVAARGRLELVNLYLKFGANPTIETGGWTAAKFARSMQHYTVAETLDKNQADKLQSLIRVYKDRYDDEMINFDLIMDLLHFIESQNMEGAVLVFLPGYEEIMAIKDRILRSDRRFLNGSKHEIYTLHSSMQSSDQRRIFLRPTNGKRKIVLSTNLAETSITIDDIVYVIDSGKVKVKSYDALTGVTALKAEWIPQASAIQRKGRAGRCQEGICFHLFSRERFEMFEKFQIPEIIRVPIEELCLQSKNLAPSDLSIAQFISLVPEAPSSLVIQRAVKLLQWMDALDPWENVTDLGRLLLELPVEPRLGKMLLTATVLHCLDPVLTVVCCLSHRDPFLLPADNEDKKAAAQRKLELAAGTLSDHMALLRSFNLWLDARKKGKQREFCHRNYLSSMTMEVIYQLRAQILDQLRKSGFVRSLDELNANASNWVAVKACLLSGLYPQVARACRSGKLSTRYDSSVRLHKTSTIIGDGSKESQRRALSKLPSEWMIFEEISTYGGHVASLRCATLISPLLLAIFGGHCRLPSGAIKDVGNVLPSRDSSSDDDDVEDDDDEWSDMTTESDERDEDDLVELCEEMDNLVYEFCKNELSMGKSPRTRQSKRKDQAKPMVEFCVDDWIRLKIEKHTAHEILRLRQKWQALFARRMRNPIASEEPGEKEIIDTLLSIITKEEEANRLPASADFGFAEIPSKHRAETKRFSPRTPRGGDVAKHQEHKAINGNSQTPTISFPVPPEQPTARQYLSNPYYKGNRSKTLTNLRFKTGIPEVDFKEQLTTTWDAEKAAGDFDFKNHLRNGNGSQYNTHQSKKFWMLRNGHRNRSSNQEETSSPIPRNQGFHGNYDGKLDKAHEPRGFYEPRTSGPKPASAPERSIYDSSREPKLFRQKSARIPERCVYGSSRQNLSPRYQDSGESHLGIPTGDNLPKTQGKKKHFRSRGQTE